MGEGTSVQLRSTVDQFRLQADDETWARRLLPPHPYRARHEGQGRSTRRASMCSKLAATAGLWPGYGLGPTGCESRVPPARSRSATAVGPKGSEPETAPTEAAILVLRAYIDKIKVTRPYFDANADSRRCHRRGT
jgi:hypothetical protein